MRLSGRCEIFDFLVDIYRDFTVRHRARCRRLVSRSGSRREEAITPMDVIIRCWEHTFRLVHRPPRRRNISGSSGSCRNDPFPNLSTDPCHKAVQERQHLQQSFSHSSPSKDTYFVFAAVADISIPETHRDLNVTFTPFSARWPLPSIPPH